MVRSHGGTHRHMYVDIWTKQKQTLVEKNNQQVETKTLLAVTELRYCHVLTVVPF